MSNNAQHSDTQEKECSCQLSQKNIWSFNWHTSLPCQQETITNQTHNNFLMKSLKRWSTNSWFMHVREKGESQKDLCYSSNTCKFIRNTSKNSINCQEVPFRNNVCRSRVRICWNIIIRMPQSFRIERYQKGCSQSQCQCCTLIFGIKVRIEVNLICLSANSQRICRSILVQCSKMNQTQSCQQKRKQIMKAIKTIQCRIISLMFA